MVLSYGHGKYALKRMAESDGVQVLSYNDTRELPLMLFSTLFSNFPLPSSGGGAVFSLGLTVEVLCAAVPRQEGKTLHPAME